MHGGLVDLVPLGCLEGFEFIFNIVNFVIEVHELLVVDLKTSLVVVDGFIELMEDISDFSGHLLASWGGHEFLVEGLEVLSFFRVTPSVEGSTEVSDWSRFLNRVPGLLDVSHFLLDLVSSSLGGGDLEHVLGGFDIFLIR